MERYKRILSISLPIIAGMMSQNILNLVDIAMVGRIGSKAIAAVGLGGVSCFLFMAFVMGFSSSVQSMAARRKGEGNENVMAVPLNGGLLLAVITGIPITIITFILTPYLFPYLNHDAEVVRLGIPYLQARLLSITVVGLNFSFRGYWNGIDRSKCYMSTLVLTNVLNIFFNWIFIFGHLGVPAYGSTGAGIASTLAIVCGTVIYFIMGYKWAKPNGFLQYKPDMESIRTLIRLALPTGTQQTFYAGGLVMLCWIIGLVSTTALAAYNIIVMLLLVGILPGIGLGVSSTSLVSQALGREDPDDAERWGWQITGVAVVLLLLIGLPMVVIPTQLLSLFSDDMDVIAVGKVPLQLTCLILGVEAIIIVCINSLLGAGDSARVMRISILMMWGLYIPLAYIAGPVLGAGLTGIWIIQLIYKIIASIVFAFMWKRRKWEGIKI